MTEIKRAHPELRKLNVLVGRWSWNSSKRGGPFEPNGQTHFEWLDGGHFLIERGKLTMEGASNTSIAVVGYDSAAKACVAQYFDSDGNAASYRLAASGSIMSIDWELYRFRGSFSDDRNLVGGTWEQSKDGTNWDYWYDLELRRL